MWTLKTSVCVVGAKWTSIIKAISVLKYPLTWTKYLSKLFRKKQWRLPLKNKSFMGIIYFSMGFIYIMIKHHYRGGEMSFKERNQRIHKCWLPWLTEKENFIESTSSRMTKTIVLQSLCQLSALLLKEIIFTTTPQQSGTDIK